PEWLAYVARREGHWDRSEAYFIEAERLDPRNVSLLIQHAINDICHRHFLKAQQKFDEALNITPDDLNILVQKASIAQAEGDLPLTNMGLGDKTAALALSERAMAANPVEKDAVAGPIPIEVLARVAARMGEPDRAIAALQKLLSIPYAGALAAGMPLTPALLRLDPMFDPLRNDPRFQKLVASPAPKKP